MGISDKGKRLTLCRAYAYNSYMPYYDEVFKHLTEQAPYALAALALKTSDVEVGEKLSTEQPTVKVHHSDLTFKVRFRNEDAVLHIEAQTDDSRRKPMPLRMLAYASFLGLEYELPVYSTVLYFRPGSGRRDPGFYEYGNAVQGSLRFRYNVIRLYELEGESFLDASSIGLLPFTALMKPPAGVDSESWVQRCVSATRAAPVDADVRATLLFGLSIFGSLAHNIELFHKFISEEVLMESPFYEEVIKRWLEQGIERGAREATIENTLTVVTERFPFADIVALKSRLEGISDINRLKQLGVAASLVPTFEAFQYKLVASENGSD